MAGSDLPPSSGDHSWAQSHLSGLDWRFSAAFLRVNQQKKAHLQLAMWLITWGVPNSLLAFYFISSLRQPLRENAPLILKARSVLLPDREHASQRRHMGLRRQLGCLTTEPGTPSKAFQRRHTKPTPGHCGGLGGPQVSRVDMRLLHNDTLAYRAFDRYSGTKRRQNNDQPLPRDLFPSMDTVFALRQYHILTYGITF